MNSPAQRAFAFYVYLPVTGPAMTDAHDFAQPLGLRAKLRVTEKTADVFGYLIKGDVKIDKAISSVKQAGMVEPMIS